MLCDIDCLQTLDSEEFACGMAEIIKYGMIFDKELLELLKEGMDGRSEQVIAKCVDLKRIVVESDEHDRGERQLLNFGHTIGHAIEKESAFAFSHGQAVAMGMDIVVKKSVTAGVCDKSVQDVLGELLKKYELDKTCNIPMEKLLQMGKVDKKRSGDFITVVLPQSVGKCCLKKMKMDEWERFIAD